MLTFTRNHGNWDLSFCCTISIMSVCAVHPYVPLPRYTLYIGMYPPGIFTFMHNFNSFECLAPGQLHYIPKHATSRGYLQLTCFKHNSGLFVPICCIVLVWYCGILWPKMFRINQHFWCYISHSVCCHMIWFDFLNVNQHWSCWWER